MAGISTEGRGVVTWEDVEEEDYPGQQRFDMGISPKRQTFPKAEAVASPHLEQPDDGDVAEFDYEEENTFDELPPPSTRSYAAHPTTLALKLTRPLQGSDVTLTNLNQQDEHHQEHADAGASPTITSLRRRTSSPVRPSPTRAKLRVDTNRDGSLNFGSTTLNIAPTPRSSKSAVPLSATAEILHVNIPWPDAKSMKSGEEASLRIISRPHKLPDYVRGAWPLPIRAFLLLAYFCTSCAYTAYRIYNLVVYNAVWGYDRWWSQLMFLIFEICSTTFSFLTMLLTMTSFAKRPRLYLDATNSPELHPTVDVLLPVCGEDLDVLIDTINAACHLDYPMGKYRVLVLDDGRNQHLREWVEDQKLPHLTYHSREKKKGVPHHAKAGNLNYGLAECSRMSPPGEYILSLDADMIAEPSIIRRLLPHLLLDSQMALACVPQKFYNIPPGDPNGQDMPIFFNSYELAKDRGGAAWCGGSGYIVRRSAMDDIGGFGIGSLGEDVYTTYLLHAKGWRTAFVHEFLQWGLAPDTFAGHVKQRCRWAIAPVQTFFLMRGYTFKTGKMTFYQRICGMVYCYANFVSMLNIAMIFCIPLMLFLQAPLVTYISPTERSYLILLASACHLLWRLQMYSTFCSTNRISLYREQQLYVFMAPYYMFAILRHFAPKWLGGKEGSFIATGSLQEQEERNENRLGLFKRCRIMIWKQGMVVHVAWMVTFLAALGFGIYQCLPLSEPVGWRSWTLECDNCMLQRIVWPPAIMLLIFSSMTAPLMYMLFPPTMPPRRDMLTPDPKTGILHPKEEYKHIRPAKHTKFGFELVWSTMLLWTVACSIWAAVQIIPLGRRPDNVTNQGLLSCIRTEIQNPAVFWRWEDAGNFLGMHVHTKQYLENANGERIMQQRRPLGILFPRNEEEVIKGVTCAGANGVKPVPRSEAARLIYFQTLSTKFATPTRSGGHSYESLSSLDDALVIDISPLSKFEINTTASTVTVSGGTRIGNLYADLYAQNPAYSFSAGTCPGVGLGGHISAGGYGMLSRKYGLAADNVVSARVILANGTAITASAAANSDVFWAVRGGGGSSFGIITEWTLRYVTVKNHYIAHIIYPHLDEFPAVLVAFTNWAQNGLVTNSSSDGGVSYSGWDFNLQFQVDIDKAELKIHYTPTTATNPETLDAILTVAGMINNPAFTSRYEIRPSQASTLQAHSFFAEHPTLSDDEALRHIRVTDIPPNEYKTADPHKQLAKSKSDFIVGTPSTRLIHSLGKTLSRSMRDARHVIDFHSYAFLQFETYGAYMASIPSNATAFPHRNVLFSMQYGVYLDQPTRMEAVRNGEMWIRDLEESLVPYVSGEHYQGYVDLDVMDVGTYYGANLDRLRRIKKDVDPKGVFWSDLV
ncbi:hypothetical protein HDV00_004668 [Rhizophlyctis rosea]|nr:hypothetical protein HDV00_004668 [Rhizophlyctis rosea]